VESACNVDLSVPRNQECLKLWQSYSCTIGCPQYGEPARFSKICYDDVRRLREACDAPAGEQGSTFFDCLSEISFIPFDWVDENEKDCYSITPHLIPASGQFEHDYCFFGDKSRCESIQDCVVKERATIGWFGSNSHTCDTHPFTPGDVNVPDTSSGRLCIDVDTCGPGVDCNAIVVFLDITNAGNSAGQNCDEAAFRLYAPFGALFAITDCNFEVMQCAAMVINYATVDTLPLQSWCDEEVEGDFPDNVVTLASEAQCILLLGIIEYQGQSGNP